MNSTINANAQTPQISLGARVGNFIDSMFEKGQGLFNRTGMNEGMTKALDQGKDYFRADWSNPVEAIKSIAGKIGTSLFGTPNREVPSQEQHEQAAKTGMQQGQTTSGFKIPTWLKVAGIAAVGIGVAGPLISNLAFPLMTMGAGMGLGGMDPTMPFSNPMYMGFDGGMSSLSSLLLLGGGAWAVKKLFFNKK